MILQQLYLSFFCMTTLIFFGMLYLWLRNKKTSEFFDPALAFLCGSIVLISVYHLNLNIKPTAVIFWTKLNYLGIFGYIYTIPRFTVSLTRDKMNRKTHILLAGLSLLCIIVTVFTDLIVKNRIVYKNGVNQAELSILYPYTVIILFSITLFYYINIINAARAQTKRRISYVPILIGLGIAIIAGIIDFIGIALGQPLIPYLPNPFIFGIFTTTLGFGWTFLSQYTWLFHNLIESREEIEKLISKSNKDFLEFVHLIAKTLEAKDHYTAGHSLRVMDYATKIARALHLPDREIELLKQACLLHDIGKISIPDGILNKKKKLTKKEREHILKHPVIGKDILRTVTEFKDILDIIYAHHERVDGSGYPDGRTKDEIPLLARILAVADAYDAMRSERPYRRAKSKEQALKELQLARGSQLDGEVVDIFIKSLSTV